MLASALFLGASVASLKLCTDEYLLLLAHPNEIASVTMLAQDPLESPLWREAKRHRSNHGSIEDVVPLRPKIVLTMGGGGRASGMIAHRLGMRVIDLPPTTSLDDIERNLRVVAGALGDSQRASPWIDRLHRLRESSPLTARDSIWLSGGGFSFGAQSAGARWLRLAGLKQRPLSGDRVTLETLLVRPPQVLVRSDYRSGQVSSGVRWLDHPVVRKLKARTISTDGRPWTCLGPLMIPEIERLKRLMK